MALFGFHFTKAAIDGLRKIQPKQTRQRVKEKIDALADEPYPKGAKKLTDVDFNGDSVYRIRHGSFRVLYVVGASEIIILDIANRKDAYRRWGG